MSHGEAERLARCFDHPAAIELVLQAANAPGWERRERSRRALACLNPDRPLIEGLNLGEPIPEWAEAVGVAAVELTLYLAHGQSRQERQRSARLLISLCREATRLCELREGEAA